jgi:hypothetical protein
MWLTEKKEEKFTYQPKFKKYKFEMANKHFFNGCLMFRKICYQKGKKVCCAECYT